MYFSFDTARCNLLFYDWHTQEKNEKMTKNFYQSHCMLISDNGGKNDY